MEWVWPAGFPAGFVYGGAGISPNYSPRSDFDQSNHALATGRCFSHQPSTTSRIIGVVAHPGLSSRHPEATRLLFRNYVFVFPTHLPVPHLGILHSCGMRRLKGGEPQHGSKSASLPNSALIIVPLKFTSWGPTRKGLAGWLSGGGVPGEARGGRAPQRVHRRLGEHKSRTSGQERCS